jgi:hypothetical protein
MKKFKLGEMVDLPSNTVVMVDSNISFKGIIVGKSTNDINQCHIVKCIDGQLPTNDYKYDTISIPFTYIITSSS